MKNVIDIEIFATNNRIRCTIEALGSISIADRILLKIL